MWQVLHGQLPFLEQRARGDGDGVRLPWTANLAVARKLHAKRHVVHVSRRPHRSIPRPHVLEARRPADSVAGRLREDVDGHLRRAVPLLGCGKSAHRRRSDGGRRAHREHATGGARGSCARGSTVDTCLRGTRPQLVIPRRTAHDPAAEACAAPRGLHRQSHRLSPLPQMAVRANGGKDHVDWGWRGRGPVALAGLGEAAVQGEHLLPLAIGGRRRQCGLSRLRRQCEPGAVRRGDQPEASR